MNRLLQISLLGCFAMPAAFPQFNPPGISKASLAYHQSRMKETSPSFGLKRVNALVVKLKKTRQYESEVSTFALPKKAFDALSTREKFTYCMVHGENFSQNCSGMPAFLNEEKSLFSHPCSPGLGEEMMSKRQEDFLHTHRGAVINFLADTMAAKGEIGCNLKNAIIELDAYELIPGMVKIFRKTGKDGDILSTLLVLMKDGKYQPFLGSATYRKLYGPDSNYQSSIDFNKANADLTIQRAMAYHNSRIRS